MLWIELSCCHECSLNLVVKCEWSCNDGRPVVPYAQAAPFPMTCPTLGTTSGVWILHNFHWTVVGFLWAFLRLNSGVCWSYRFCAMFIGQCFDSCRFFLRLNVACVDPTSSCRSRVTELAFQWKKERNGALKCFGLHWNVISASGQNSCPVKLQVWLST